MRLIFFITMLLPCLFFSCKNKKEQVHSNTRDPQIIKKVLLGDFEAVKSMINSDKSLMYLKDSNGHTPVNVAILTGRNDIAIYLIESGYPLIAPNGNDSLIYNCLSRPPPKADKMLEYLLSNGSSPNPATGSYIHLALNSEEPARVKLLVQHGASLHTRRKGKTPLEFIRDRISKYKNQKFDYPHKIFTEYPKLRKKAILRWQSYETMILSLLKEQPLKKAP